MRYSLEKTYLLNPAFNIRADAKRILLYNSTIDPGLRINSSDVLVFLHPLYATILAVFDGKNSFGKIIKDLSAVLKLSEEETLKLVAPLINNEEEIQFEFDGFSFFLPPNIIIEKEPGIEFREFQLKDFLIPKGELDLVSWRLYRPLDGIFMLNASCVTNCIYCYAKRIKWNNSCFTLQRIKEVIREARAIGMRSLDLTGGEVFLYPNWPEILEELLQNGFNPYISTKIPLDLDTLKLLKGIGINRIQISIDSIIPEEVRQILGVDNNYYPRLLQTLKDLDRLGFTIYTNSQITNQNYERIEKLLDFLLELDNIGRISIGAAGYSLYNGKKYYDYAISLESFQKIEHLLNRFSENAPDHLILNISGYSQESGYKKDSQNIEFKKRARCSGNFYAFFVLPDGRVTICEELYDHPAFLIGDLTKQSIMEMWSSEEARGLYKLSKNRIREESPCFTCEEFNVCRQKKGVCWKEVLYAYGEKNWDFPDPRCKLAPQLEREFYLK